MIQLDFSEIYQKIDKILYSLNVPEQCPHCNRAFTLDSFNHRQFTILCKNCLRITFFAEVYNKDVYYIEDITYHIDDEAIIYNYRWKHCSSISVGTKHALLELDCCYDLLSKEQVAKAISKYKMIKIFK